jgi:stage II sporulation protein GA (sporulation sigma-E factor processing peptidase)
MSVYIESVILDNFFVTLLISLLSYRALSIRRSRRRHFFAALTGTAVAVAYPLLDLHAAFLVLIKLALAAVLVLILFYKKAKMFPAACVFLGLTFAFGGALFAIGYAFYGDVHAALTLPVTFLPTGLIIAAALVLYLIYKKIVRKLKRVRDAKTYLVRAEIDALGKTVSGVAFLDTGNRLYDPKTDLPVVVLGAEPSLQILGDSGLCAMLRGQIGEISPSARYMEIGGVAGSGRLLLLKPDALRFYIGQVKHTIVDVELGLSLKKLSDAAGYDMLLHPALFDATTGLLCGKNHTSAAAQPQGDGK